VGEEGREGPGSPIEAPVAADDEVGAGDDRRDRFGDGGRIDRRVEVDAHRRGRAGRERVAEHGLGADGSGTHRDDLAVAFVGQAQCRLERGLVGRRGREPAFVVGDRPGDRVDLGPRVDPLHARDDPHVSPA
jgi:hypothetical protein